MFWIFLNKNIQILSDSLILYNLDFFSNIFDTFNKLFNFKYIFSYVLLLFYVCIINIFIYSVIRSVH